MNELLQLDIMQKLYPVQKIAHISASAGRKIKCSLDSAFCPPSVCRSN